MTLNPINQTLVLFSGGMDSTICLLLAIEKYGKENVVALSFVYGHRKKQCLEVGKETCKKLGVKHEIFDAYLLNELAGEKIIEGRNLFFLSFAALYARSRKISNVYSGICYTRRSLHNDHTQRFVVEGCEFIKPLYQNLWVNFGSGSLPRA